MAAAVNQTIAGHLDEVANLLAHQGANRFRVGAYRHAATTVRRLAQPVAEIFARDGLPGLEALPGVGESIARAIRDLLLHGRLAMLDRLRGEHDPLLLLGSVPGIGRTLARKLHDDLGIESLADLETAAHDGRLEILTGLGAKRLAGIRDSLAHRLGRTRSPAHASTPAAPPDVAELLDVDREYRSAAAADRLKKSLPSASTRRARPGCPSCTPAAARATTPPSSPTPPTPMPCAKPTIGSCCITTAPTANNNAPSSPPSSAPSRASA